MWRVLCMRCLGKKHTFIYWLVFMASSDIYWGGTQQGGKLNGNGKSWWGCLVAYASQRFAKTLEDWNWRSKVNQPWEELTFPTGSPQTVPLLLGSQSIHILGSPAPSKDTSNMPCMEKTGPDCSAFTMPQISWWNTGGSTGDATQGHDLPYLLFFHYIISFYTIYINIMFIYKYIYLLHLYL